VARRRAGQWRGDARAHRAQPPVGILSVTAGNPLVRRPPTAVIAERLAGRGPRWSLCALALVASFAFGLIAGVKPTYAIAGVLAIGYVVVVFSDIVLGFSMFAALTFLETLSSGSTASVDKLAGLLVLVAWLARLATTNRRLTVSLPENRGLAIWLVLYLVLNAVSVEWSTSGSAAVSQTYRYTLDALLIPITYSIVETRRDLLKIIVGYLVGASISVLYGLVYPAGAGAAQAGRLTGGLGEANQSATVLVAAMALCVGIWLMSRRSPRMRLFIIGVVVLSVVGLVGTLSRSGLIAFAVVLVLAMFVGGRWRRAAMWVCVFFAIAGPVYFVTLAGQRAHRVDSGQTSGRDDIWLVALRAWEAHPVLGVGAGNFEVVSHLYLQQPGLIVSANYFIYQGLVVQNIYLEQLTTLGPLGLILMIGVFAAALQMGVRSVRTAERIGDLELEMLSRFWILAVAAFLTADFFASELVDKQLWIVLAFGPVLLKLGRSAEPASSSAPPPPALAVASAVAR
jgi:O-antigen ligase